LDESTDKLIQARLLDLAAWVREHHQPRSTPFLDPARVIVAEHFLQREASDLNFVSQGGYPEAERRIILITPGYLEPEAEFKEKELLAALLITWPERYYSLSHRDILGAILGLRLKRGQVGDILMDSGQAQVVTTSDIAPYVATQLKSAGRAPVIVTELSLAGLNPPQPKVKEIRTSIASPRLDCILAAAFGLSRSKALNLISSERVQVNFEPVTNPAYKVAAGALLSVRGLGRARVVSFQGQSKKGRTFSVLERYL
jgi:RNA-binding protein YlmH